MGPMNDSDIARSEGLVRVIAVRELGLNTIIEEAFGPFAGFVASLILFFALAGAERL